MYGPDPDTSTTPSQGLRDKGDLGRDVFLGEPTTTGPEVVSLEERETPVGSRETVHSGTGVDLVILLNILETVVHPLLYVRGTGFPLTLLRGEPVRWCHGVSAKWPTGNSTGARVWIKEESLPPNPGDGRESRDGGHNP